MSSEFSMTKNATVFQWMMDEKQQLTHTNLNPTTPAPSCSLLCLVTNQTHSTPQFKPTAPQLTKLGTNPLFVLLPCPIELSTRARHFLKTVQTLSTLADLEQYR